MKTFLAALLLSVFTLPALAKNTILIIGDSISAGYGIDPRQGWAALLQKRLNDEKYNYQVVNASISGDTTSDGLARLPAALGQYHPQITIIELGGNDGLRGLQLDVIKNNLQQMIDDAKKAGSKVLLLGVRMPPNYGEAYTARFQQIYTNLASENHISVVPIFLESVDTNPRLMQDDRIHPTTDAQPILLNNAWPELEKMISK